MVGYGANKVNFILLRVSFPSPANKFSTGFPKTQIKTKSMKLMYRWWKSITKKFRTCSSLLTKDLLKVTKSDSIKHWEFTSKAWVNILWIPMRASRKKCKKAAETDQLQPQLWMPHLQELTPLFRLNSSSASFRVGKRGKSYLLFTWSIWQVLKKWERLVLLEIDWRKLQV